ncbi:MAG: PadR family transcriptional regulator [Elusimicrobiota bacterium]
MKNKGKLKMLILHFLREGKALNGYQLMEKIQEITGKKPSTGTIYPLLRKLTQKGYIVKSPGQRNISYRMEKSCFTMFELAKEEFYDELIDHIKISEVINDVPDKVKKVLK